MALYDVYELYRPNFDKEQQERINQAGIHAREIAASGTPDAKAAAKNLMLQTYMKLAVEQAARQLESGPVMPEDGDISFRFPELDPTGKYSVIDMKFAHRYNLVQNTLQVRTPAVQENVAHLQQELKNSESFRQLHAQMRETSRQHRLLTRASKLCWNEEGRTMLHLQARSLETSDCIIRYNLVLQGLEYAAGARSAPNGIPEDVVKQYRDMGLNLSVDPAEASRSAAPQTVHIRFQNFDNQMLQRWQASPGHWTAATAEGATPTYRADEAYTAVQYYAMTTVSCALRPVFAPARSKGMQPVDLVLIEGVRLRDTLEDSSSDLTPHQVDELATSAIAGALMAGKKVEALIPDENGNLPQRPIPICRDGYTPSPLQQVIYNAWERFVSRQGFFKARTAMGTAILRQDILPQM